MPLYTFYPSQPNGTSATFVAEDLADDDAAMKRAVSIVAEHRGSSYVVVWQGERKAFVYQRGGQHV